MEFNFYLTNQECLDEVSTRAEASNGVVITSCNCFTSPTFTNDNSICDTWAAQGEIKVVSGYGLFETELCSYSLIEKIFSQTSVLKQCFNSWGISYLVFAPYSFNNERELLEYVASALQKEGHYAQVLLNNYSVG